MPLNPLRPVAAQTLALNAGLLEQAPSTAPSDPRDPRESLTSAPGGFASGLWEHVKDDFPKAAIKGDRLAKGLGEAHLRGLGPVTDVIDLATAHDKRRAAAGIVGGEIGGALGAAIQGLDVVTAPLGAMAGNWAGHTLYDHRGDIRDAVAQGLADRIRPYMPPVTRDRF